VILAVDKCEDTATSKQILNISAACDWELDIQVVYFLINSMYLTGCYIWLLIASESFRSRYLLSFPGDIKKAG
jgi:hypothetical protein